MEFPPQIPWTMANRALRYDASPSGRPSTFGETAHASFSSVGIGGGFALFDWIHNEELRKRNKELYTRQRNGDVPRDIINAATPLYSVWNKNPYYDQVTRMLRERGDTELKTSDEIDDMIRPSIKIMQQEDADVLSRAIGAKGFAAQLTGGAVTYLTDPLTMGVGIIGSPLGGAVRAASYLARATKSAAILGGIEGGIELARQPAVLDWRFRMEEEYNTWDQVMTIGWAAAGGAVMGPVTAFKWADVLQKFAKHAPDDGTKAAKIAKEIVKREAAINKNAPTKEVTNIELAQGIDDAKTMIDDTTLMGTEGKLDLTAEEDLVQEKITESILKQEQYRYNQATPLREPKPPKPKGRDVTPDEVTKDITPDEVTKDITPEEMADLQIDELEQRFDAQIEKDPNTLYGVDEDGVEISALMIDEVNRKEISLLQRAKECAINVI